jgi:hypothetical protein
MRMLRRARAVAVALAVAVFLFTLVSTLLHSEPRYAGSNAVRAAQVVTELAPRRTICQKGELIPKDASTVEVSVATGGQPGPPLAAELRTKGGRVLARGTTVGGYRDGVIGVPIGVVRKTIEHVDVCLRSTAPGTAQLYGQGNAEGRLEVNRHAAPGILRLAYKRPGSETWLALAPTIAHRFAQAKTRVATPFTFWLLLVGVVGVAGLAVRSVLVDDEDEAVA